MCTQVHAGARRLRAGCAQVARRCTQVRAGARRLRAGWTQVARRCAQVRAGARRLRAGARRCTQVHAGCAQVHAGARKLRAGLPQKTRFLVRSAPSYCSWRAGGRVMRCQWACSILHQSLPSSASPHLPRQRRPFRCLKSRLLQDS